MATSQPRRQSHCLPIGVNYASVVLLRGGRVGGSKGQNTNQTQITRTSDHSIPGLPWLDFTHFIFACVSGKRIRRSVYELPQIYLPVLC